MSETSGAASRQPDYYAVLGLDATASATITADDIKAAYRAAAKRAHPDAGGDAAAMERVNEAHRILSDPLERRDYDRRRADPPPEPHHAAEPSPTPNTSHAPEHPDHHAPRQPHAAHTGAPDPAAFAHLRRSQARRNALQILRRSALAAVLLNILSRYALIFATDAAARIILKLLGFAPLYAVLLGVIFLISPQIRLDLFDLMQHLRRRGPNPHLEGPDKAALFALAIGFIPLAIIWIILT